MILPLPPPPHHRRIFLLCFGIPAAYSSDCTLNTTLIRAHTARTPKLIHTLIQSAHTAHTPKLIRTHTAHTPKLIRTHTAQTPHTHSFPYNQGQQIPYTHIHIPCVGKGSKTCRGIHASVFLHEKNTHTTYCHRTSCDNFLTTKPSWINPMNQLKIKLITVRCLIYGMFNHMGFSINGTPLF